MKPSDDESFEEVVTRLTERLGRAPTGDEVYQFIFGSEMDRLLIWNLNKSEEDL